MWKIVISAFLFLISFFTVNFLQSKASFEFEKENYFQYLSGFNNFWAIYLSKPFYGISLIGYKQEQFDKENKTYLFIYKFKNIKGLNLNIQPKIQGQVYFGKNYNIKSVNILLAEKYLLQGEKENDKFKLSLQQIGQKIPLWSKLIDYDKLNFDFFLFNLLPFYNLQLGKTYTYSVLDLTSLAKDKLSFVKMLITRKTKNFYLIDLNGIKFSLRYKNNYLVYKSNPFFYEKLVKQNQIVSIKSQINGKLIKKSNSQSNKPIFNLQKEIESLKKRKEKKYCPILDTK